MKRILIVDDEETILAGLSKSLNELCDFQGDIRTVANGRDALLETCLNFYDLCFLDVVLPDISGFSVLHHIRKNSPETSIVLMSACYTHNNIDILLKNGEAYFIEKPFNFIQIKDIVIRALEGTGDSYKDLKSRSKKELQGKRKYERRPFNKVISFYVKESNLMEFKGDITDISYAGVGINTYYPLERGNTLFFNKGVAHRVGIVSWSAMESSSKVSNRRRVEW